MSHKSFYSKAVSLGGFDDQNFSSLAYYFSVAKKNKCIAKISVSVIDILSQSILQLLYLTSDYILANSNPECLNSIQYKAGPNQELTLQEKERIIETNLRLEHREKVLTTSGGVQDNSAGLGF